MTRLEHYAALTESHETILEVVARLESMWGHGARVREIAAYVGFSEIAVRRLLEELDGLSLVVWQPDGGVAWSEGGRPMLGEVA